MAEHETPEPQLLHEFTQNLITDLRSGAISAQEALAASWQYSFLREELGGEEETLRAALLVGGDAFKESLITSFTAIQTKLADLPNFASQQPDVPRTEQEIRDVAALRAFAIDRVQKTSSAGHPNIASRRREFIHSVVTKYSSTIPTLTQAGVESTLVVASQNNSPQTFTEAFVSSIGGTQDMKNDILEILTQDREFLPALSTQTRHDAALYTALLEHLDTDRPDVLVDVVLNAPPTESIEQSILRATKLAGVADAIQDSDGHRGGKLQFFSSDGAKGVYGGLQKGVDGILSLVGEPVREMILAEKVNGTLRDMLRGSQKFVDRLGENFVRSAFFTHVTQDLTKQLGDKVAGKGQARTVFDDLVSSIIRGPMDTPLNNVTEERMLDYYELMRANANAPKDKKFMTAGLLPWELYALPLLPRKQRVWKFPLLGFGAFGNWLGNIFSDAVDQTTSFLFTNPRLPGQLSSSRRAAAIPIPVGEDMPLLVAVVVIAVLLIFFIFPNPFNLSQISHSSKASALFAALQNLKDVTSGTLAEVTSFRCEWNGPTPPAGAITTCPVHAPITQRPFTPGQSHANANAYDFGAGQGTPVVAGHNAFVVSYVNSYAPNQYQYASYGNNVVLVATDPSTNTQYCTNYAHLLDVDPIVIANAGKPNQISAGTTIGFVDTTGYTYGSNGPGTGTHLHWGYKGADPRKDFLPPGCP